MHLRKLIIIAALVAGGLGQAGCTQPPDPVAQAPNIPSAPTEPPARQPPLEQNEPAAAEDSVPADPFPDGPYYLPADPDVLAEIDDGNIAQPEHAVAVLQLLLDQEYEALLDLDPKKLDPSLTRNWAFASGDYQFLSDLANQGARSVGHAPAQILSVAQINNLPSGDWELTVLTSELGMEIIDAAGESVVDTRGDGATMATYTISPSAGR